MPGFAASLKFVHFGEASADAVHNPVTMVLEFQVYILLCTNGHYYVGCTSDLDERIIRHSKGQVHYTKDKLPVKCVAAFGFNDKYLAFNFEKYLKSGSGRAFLKRHLIAQQASIGIRGPGPF